MQQASCSVSLITYNMHKGFGFGAVRFLLPKMREAISTLNPDFVFLQEVQGEHKKKAKRILEWPESSQYEYLAGKTWPFYTYAKNAVYRAGHHGNAILSKYPFGHIDNISLTNNRRASRGVLHTQLLIDRIPIHLLCVHLGLFKKERSEQMIYLMHRIKTLVPLHEPLIMAGDFNDWQNTLSKPLAETLQVEEAFISVEGSHARSFPAIRPALCVDRVYYRGMKVTEVACLQGHPWRLLSDHLPLFTRFELI